MKIFLCLALVLSGSLFAHANEPNAPTSTDTRQSFVPATLKTNWTDTKVTLYRTTGAAVQLDAKREVVAVRKRGMPAPFDVNVTAFVDSNTGNAWVGSAYQLQEFYVETESGIVRGEMLFGSNKPLGNEPVAFGRVFWDGSLVSSVQRGQSVDAVIEQLNKTNDLNWVATAVRRERTTVIADSSHKVETGLNPWFFIAERHGKQIKQTTIEAIDVSDGKLRLDLKNPTGNHKASVWIDLKTWQVVKVIQDDKP